MRKGLIGCGAALVSVLICAGAAWFIVGKRVQASPTQSERTYIVERGEVAVEVSESGALEPVRVVEIKSRVPGRIESLLVDEGAIVEQGQLLARIDPREIKQQVEQGSAQVESAQASAQRARIALEMEAEQARLQLRQAEIRYEQAQREADTQPTLTQAALKNAENTLKTAQENLRLLREVKHPQERVEVANAVRDAETRLQEARRNYDRLQSLLEKGYVSRQQVDAAQTVLVSAESQLRNLQQRQQQLAQQHAIEIQNAQTQVESAQAELERARASAVQDELKRKALEAARTDLQNARLRLREVEMRQLELKQARASEKQAVSNFQNLMIQFSETDVRAPIRGVVTRRYREVGELVMSGTTGFGEGTPILQVADLSQMRVRLNLNELDVAKLRVGMPVEITVDALPERKFKGAVRKIAPAAQNSGQTTTLGVVKFAVEVYLNQTDDALRPGMTARCRILTAQKTNALRLPLEAIGKENGKDYVLRLIPNQSEPDGKPKTEKVFVKVGLRSASHAEILDGLREGDKVQKPPFAGPQRRQFEMGRDRDGESESEE
ncbi:MAG: efflux RND transporter periplasmic adaptor subunit [Fimbriimonadales bacterium]|nr:efflux RND transporter periplasmic adaptor subunit [Fimbriimonadales bacterium]